MDPLGVDPLDSNSLGVDQLDSRLGSVAEGFTMGYNKQSRFTMELAEESHGADSFTMEING